MINSIKIIFKKIDFKFNFIIFISHNYLFTQLICFIIIEIVFLM